MGINLDNLFDDKKPIVEEASGVMDVAVTPKVQIKKGKTKEETSTNGIYDQLKTLFYSIDISGSMDAPIDTDKPQSWDWPLDLKNHISRQLSYSDDLSEHEQELKNMLGEATDEQLKEVLVSLGPTSYGIYTKFEPTNTKMNLVKTAVADLVDRRYEKFPDARVVLQTFNFDSTIEAATHESIKTRLASLTANGGTNIYGAVVQALAYFEQYPSPVGLNHLIIVSDGEDWQAMQIKEDLLGRMKEQGVVLDYIYIKGKQGMTNESTQSAVAKMFTDLCKELGGDYVEVSSSSEFEKKLLAASTRLCLPPGV